MDTMEITTFHDGFLAWDMLKEDLVVTDLFIDTLLPVYLENDYLFIIEDNIKLFVDYEDNKFVLSTSQKVSYDIGYENDFFYLKRGCYLTCRKDRSLKFSANEVLGWEQFYKKQYRKNNDLNFNKDVFILKNNKSIIKPIEKNIWVYWDGEDSILVNNCIERMRNYNPEYKLVVLNKENSSQYIENELLEKISGFTVQLQSDVIRLYLLKRYGGVWFDATVVLNDSLDAILPENNSFDLIGFYLRAHFQKFGLNKIPIIENWFLAAPKNSPLIEDWLCKLLEICEIGHEGLLKKLRERDDFYIITNEYSEERWLYFLAYLTQQALFLDKPDDYNILARCADYSGLYYQVNFNWGNQFKFRELMFFKQSEIAFLPKLIKMTGEERRNFDQLQHLGILHDQSYLFRLINL